MNLCYPAFFEPQQPEGYFVRFVDIPEAFTQGATLEECLRNAEEVLSLVLEERLEENRPMPAPLSTVAGACFIAQDWQVAEIRQAIQEADAGDFAEENEVQQVRAQWLGGAATQG
jgi:predicted RNase H-like HicB family nuclease